MAEPIASQINETKNRKRLRAFKLKRPVMDILRTSLAKLHLSSRALVPGRCNYRLAQERDEAGFVDQLEILEPCPRLAAQDSRLEIENVAPARAQGSRLRRSSADEQISIEPPISMISSRWVPDAGFDERNFDPCELLDRRNVVLERHAAIMDRPRTNLTYSEDPFRAQVSPSKAQRFRKSLAKRLPRILINWFQRLRSRKRWQRRTVDVDQEEHNMQRELQAQALAAAANSTIAACNHMMATASRFKTSASASEQHLQHKCLQDQRLGLPHRKPSDCQSHSNATQLEPELRESIDQHQVENEQRLSHVNGQPLTLDNLHPTRLQLRQRLNLSFSVSSSSSSPASFSGSISQNNAISQQEASCSGLRPNQAAILSLGDLASKAASAGTSLSGSVSANTCTNSTHGQTPKEQRVVIRSNIPRSNVINFAQLVNDELDQSSLNFQTNSHRENHDFNLEDTNSNSNFCPQTEFDICSNSYRQEDFGEEEEPVSVSPMSSFSVSKSSHNSLISYSASSSDASSRFETQAKESQQKDSQYNRNNMSRFEPDGASSSLDHQLKANSLTTNYVQADSAHRTTSSTCRQLRSLAPANQNWPDSYHSASSTSIARAEFMITRQNHSLVPRSITYNSGFLPNSNSMGYGAKYESLGNNGHLFIDPHFQHLQHQCNRSHSHSHAHAYPNHHHQHNLNHTHSFHHHHNHLNHHIRPCQIQREHASNHQYHHQLGQIQHNDQGAHANTQRRRSLQFHPSYSSYVQNQHQATAAVTNAAFCQPHRQQQQAPENSHDTNHSVIDKQLLVDKQNQTGCLYHPSLRALRVNTNNLYASTGETINTKQVASQSHLRHRFPNFQLGNDNNITTDAAQHDNTDDIENFNSSSKIMALKTKHEISHDDSSPSSRTRPIKKANHRDTPRKEQVSGISKQELTLFNDERKYRDLPCRATQPKIPPDIPPRSHKRSDTGTKYRQQFVTNQPPMLLVNSHEMMTPIEHQLVSPQPQPQRQRIVLQASTSELMRCLCDFIQIRCSKLKNFSASHVMNWLKQVDKTLLFQGWQEIGFINPANVVFLYMLLRDLIHNDVESENELQAIIMTSLYLSYAYMGNEISYPLQPFLWEQDCHENFWDRVLKIINLMSGNMLRLNAEPSYFAEVFSELKNYQYISRNLQDNNESAISGHNFVPVSSSD